MTSPPRPVVRLRPQAGRPRLIPAPWHYADEVVLDRRTRAIPAGTVVELQDAERRLRGGCVQRRLEDRGADARPRPGGGDRRRLVRGPAARALALREALYDAPFYRLVHAEADGLPGVVIDRFGDAAVVQPNAAWADARLDAAGRGAARGHRRLDGGEERRRPRARRSRGCDDDSAVLAGPLDGPVAVPMNGAIYFADLAQGQKTGLFYDQRPNHAFAAAARARAERARRLRACGRLRAGRAGRGARPRRWPSTAPRRRWSWPPRGAAASGVAERFETRRGDAFDAMAALAAEGRRFGLVVCDPPAFAPTKAALEAGLRAYERVARLGAALVEPDGFLVLCSCSHAADLARFREASLRGVAQGRSRGADPARGRRRTRPPGAPGAGRDLLSQGALPAARTRCGC